MGFKVVTKKMVEASGVTETPDDFFGIIVKYIPAPVIAGYKLVEEMFVAAGRTSEMPWVFLLFLAITPLAVMAMTKEKGPMNKEHLKSIKVQVVMTALAFIIWTLVMSRWMSFDPLWGTVFLVLFTIGAPAVGLGFYEKGF